ncbi:tenascin-X isoform X8 [Sus scrofa]|uniref:tenascin-X isoform X8 n=1 Tax=Sus scrofa TaxID=9823 RepID=UPI000A2B6452|nr:tenascin-X isoform X8 [Sus scrofa]
MMSAQSSLTSNLALLVLLGTVKAGPFSPRSNVTLPAPRPPPQPGGGSPSSQLYEHTVAGGEKQVVFTHRINLPPSAGCGCPPGTEPPVPASEVQALRVRLEILEELVKGLKEQCTGGCCTAAAQAGTGQTDVRSLCSLHGAFDLSRCACSCEPGWGGPTCSDPTEAEAPASSPPSDARSCPDDCNDQGRCIRGRCVCFPGYTGPSCSWPSCPGDCHGRGRCVKGVCVCRAGFSGDDCSLRSCPRGCSQRGRCEDGRCVCDSGYTGEDCAVRSCPRDCSQRGRCQDGRCVCNPGYTGEDCGVRSCPRGCSQKGRCEDGRCVCDPGYTGEDCGSRSCPWDCGEGGRCVDGRCVCWPGYAGEDCSTRTCPRDCRGRGRCEDGECICNAGYSGDDCGVRSCPGDCNQRGRCEDGRCVCWPGYSGPDCGARACPRDCRGRGRCENGVCVCNAGYSGEDCGVRSCPGDCLGRGRCENGRCVCWPGYTGRDCGTRACPGDCRGRGRCVDGRCVCNPGFTGEDCGSHRCPGDCRGRGRCEDGVCLCDVGYEGKDCGVRSCPGGCRGRGQCVEGRCVCEDGYEGEDCAIRRCPRDCSQRGVCRDGVCTCWEGYAGEDCSLRTCPSNCHRRGLCEDGRCVCESGYTGPSCATRTCPADCRGRGRCVQGVCLCHAGYSGEDCGQEEPPASACPGGCGPRELCRAGQCVCVEGFRGPDCAIQTCPEDCRGRGECHEGRCVCQDGYAGEDCGEEVPAIEGMRMHLLEETTVRTEWTRAPGNVDAYEIQFIPTTEGVSPPFTARVPSSASAYDQRGLAPGQEYQVTVRALRGTNWGPPASKTITTMIDGPQDLRVVAVTPTTLELNWLRPQAEVDRFVVSYVSAGNQRVRLEVPSEADGTLLTGLMPGVEYVVTVTAERGQAVSYPASVRANTGSSPSGLLGATDEPPPSGPSTTQGAQAPVLQQRPQELGELRVLGKDKTGRLRVAWTAQPDTFDHFQLRLRVPEGPGPHEELLPGDVRQALMPSPPPGSPYELSLRGVPPGGEPSAPLIYQGIMDRDGEKPEKPMAPPRLGQLTATDITSSSLLLRWTVPEGEFDSFVIQYKDRDQPQVVPVEGPQRSALISNLEVGRKYKFVLYGLVGKKRHGPLVAEAKIMPQTDPGPATPPRLGKLWVTDPTPNSLHLSWTVPEGQFDSFVVQYRDRDGRPQVLPVEGPERSVTVSPLDPEHKYRFTLFGIANRKRHGPLTADGTTAPEKREEPHHQESPEQPLLGELTVTGTTPDSLRLSWTVAQGSFDSFTVQYKDAQGRPQVVPVKGDENEVTIPGLESDRKYRMNLYGLHGRQRVGPVSVVAATAPQEVVDETPSSSEEEETPSPTEMEETPSPMEPPEEPILGELTVTGSSPDSLSLSWTVPQGHFDSFTVQYKNGDGQPKAVRVPGHEDQVTISGLEPDHKYKMNLYGFHDGQRVGPVSVIGVTTAEEETPSPTEMEETPSPTERPEEPILGELTVTGSSPDSLSLSWTVPQGHFDSFTVQYKGRAGPQVVRVGGEESEVTVEGLEAGRKYKMHLYGLHRGQRVGPVSTVGVTAPEPEEVPPATEPPQEPRLGELTVTDVTPNSVGLVWTVPEGQFDSFVVQYKDRDGQPQTVPVAADQREVTVPGLEPARKYKMNLYGLHDGQRVGPLSVVAVTAPVPPAPATEPPPEPRLGELTVTDVTPDSVGLSWTVPEGEFDSFVVQYKDRDGQPQVVPVAADQHEVTVPDLEPNRKYKFLLFGIQDGKRRSPVSVEAKTVPRSDASAGAPPRLGELWVTDPTPDSLHLSWTVPEGHFDSFVVQFKDRDGPQVVPVEGHERSVTVAPLDAGRKYRFLLYGLLGKRRHGPLTGEGTTETRRAVDEAGTKRPSKPRLGEELEVTSVTSDSVVLSWAVPEGHFDSFVVQYKDRDGQPQVVPVEGSLREVTVSDLDPARRYKLLLYGLYEGKRVGPLSAIAVTEPAPREEMEAEAPSLPASEPRLGEVTMEEATPHTLHLSWTLREGEFNSFEVQYTDKNGQLQVVSLGGDQNDVTLSGLESDHRYLVSLYGFHDGQRVGPAQVEALTAPREEEDEPSEPPSTTPEPLTKPRLEELTVTDATPESLQLSWTVPEGQFDHFLVQYKNGDGQPKAVRVPGHEDQVTISGLEPDHKYKMNLYGFHDGQRVGPVSVIGVTTAEEETPSPTEMEETPSPTEPPEEPILGELTVTGSSPDSLSLSWTVPQGHFDSFTVQYKGRAGPQVVRVGGEESEVTVEGLEAGRKYKMHLYGFHDGQRVGPVSVIGVTTAEEETPSSTEMEETPSPTERPEEPILGELTVTGSSPDSLSLSWTVPQGHFDSFTVQYKGRAGPQVVRVGGEESEVTVEGLEAGRKYKMNLYGFYDGQRVGPLSTVGVTDPQEEPPASPPLKPRLGELTVTDATPESLQLSWAVPEGQFDHFLVQYKNGDGQPKAVRVPGHEDQVTISGLEPDHKYKMNLYGFHYGQRMGPVSVIGLTAPDYEAMTTEVPITMAPEPPTKPRLEELTVTDATPESLQLSWTVPEGQFDHFLVQYKNGDGQPKAVRVPGHEDKVTISGLEPDHKYKMNLYGFHDGQRVGPVSVIGVTTAEEETPSPTEMEETPSPTEPPEEPILGELTVTGSSPDSLSLSWTVPQGHFDSFTVQYKGRAGPQVVRVGGEESEVTVEGLEPDHKYKMHLYGFHDGQRVGPVSVIGVTTAEEETPSPTEMEETPSPTERPEEPILGELTVTGSSPDSLSLSWTVPQGHFDSFTVQYKGRAGPQVVRVGGEESEVTVEGLEAGRKYKMNLYGFYDGQRVGPLSTVGVTDPQEEPPASPPLKPRLGELTVTDATPESLQLSWAVPEGQFDHFLVQYKNGDGQPKAVRVPGHEDQVTISGLEPDHKYKMNLYGFHYGQRMGPVSVIGLTAPDYEAMTTEVPITMAPEPPTKPRLEELTVTDATPESLQLSWTVPEGQFDHFLVQYKNGDGQPKAVRVPGHEDKVTISGLEPDHKYKMNLYGFHDGQRVGPVSVIGVTTAEEETPSPTEMEETPSPTEPPEEPILGELTVTGSSPDSLSLSWTVPQGHFDSFTVQYKGRAGPQVVRVGGEESEVTVEGLEPDHKYKMHLYGFHDGQRVGPVSVIGVTTAEEETPSPTEMEETPSPTEPPEEPILGELTVTGSSPDSLSLSWTVPQGHFDSFTVQYKGRAGPQVVRVGGEESEVTVEGLEPNHKYKMHLYGFYDGQRVGPVSTVGVTAPQEVVEETPSPTEMEETPSPTEPPEEPILGELTVTGSSPDSLSLSWTVPQGHFDSFTVQYKGRAGPQVVRVGGEESEVTVEGLEPDHKYKMHLYGFHDGQRVGPVSVIGVTTAEEETPSPTEMEETPSPTEMEETPSPTERPEEPILGELTVTGSSPDSLSLSWTVPQGHFDSFTVQYKGRAGPQVVRVGGEESEVTVEGLEAGRKYKMHLYGFHDGQRVGPVSVIGVTTAEEETPSPTEMEETPSPTEMEETPSPTERPEEPILGELTVTGSSPDSLSLSWTVPQGHFDSFTVQYKGRAGPQVVRVGGEESEVTVEGLEAGRKYKMNLYGFHDGQRVGPVSTVGVTAPDYEAMTTEVPLTMAPEPPTKPRLEELTVTDATPESLQLSWTVPEGQFDHFLVQYKNGDGQPKAVRVPGHEDQVTISGLEPDHKYKMNLYGFHDGQRVGPVSVVGVTTAEEETPSPTEMEETPSPTEMEETPSPTERPEEPILGELTVTGSSPDSLSLSWTVPQGHFDSFTVQYKGRAGPQVVRVGGEESEVTVEGLEPDHKYKMHLYGFHDGQRVGPVSTVGMTASMTTEPPVAPRLGELATAAVTSDTVGLSWTVAQGRFDSFLVQYRDAQGQPQAVPVAGDLREVTVSGLAPARKYKFLLFGLQDEKRHGPVSADAKTLPDTKPSPRLGELTVTGVTLDSVGLSWTVPEGEFDSFVVQYKDRDGQPQVVPVAADQREVTVSDLEPSKKYKFLLYGLAGRKRLGPISAEGSTAPLEKERQPPPRLGELTVTAETQDSLRLSWTVARGPFDSFVVQYRTTDGQSRAVPVAADQREVTIEGLEPGRKYKFLLYGLQGGQRLGPVPVLGVTAPEEDTPAPWRLATEAPKPPEGPRLGTLAVSEVSPDSLRLSWRVAQGPFDSFVVQYQDADGQPQALLVGGDQSKVLVSGLEPSTSYTFFLHGLHEGKRLGPVSAEGTTGPAPAGQSLGESGPRLSHLSVTDVTTGSLRLNWEAPSEAFDSFLLRFGVPSPSTVEPHPRPLLQRELTVPGTRRSAVLRDLRPGTLYTLTLYGLRGPHKADSIQGTARTLSPVLESPRDLQFSEIGETSAKVSWMPPSSRVDGFKVSYQLADGGEPQSVQVDGRGRTQKLEGLTPGARYEVTVVSMRGFEESEPLSGFLTTVPDGPTQLRALNLTEGSALLHWKPPQTPVDTYDVKVTASGAPSLQGSAPGSAVDYPLHGLELHTNYTATLRGLRGPNLTSPASITFTTGLEAPQDLEAKEVTPRTVLLTWTAPQVPPTGYLITFNTPGGQTQEILLPGGVTSHRLQGLFPSTPYSAWLRAMWGESFTPPVSTSFTTGGLRIPFPRDCGEEMQNGVSTSRTTTIFLNGNRERPLNVFCDMETDGGGWLVFQRRMDGKTDFWRDWEDYAHGFGNISGEFWLGNEALHSLTKAGDYSLRVDLRAGEEAVFAQYESFQVDSAAEHYRLHLEGYHGTAGDSMSYHSGSVFSARDRDPNNLLISCAVSYRGAWWYRNCHYANLNGLYGSTVDHQGVSWYYWKGFEFSVPFTEMKLRPRSFQPPGRGG